ncbi:restriction endonuclease subunit S [Clostridium perfringens]|uniref:restriction endonuclease subunit S n=1 Tax=Clostridium perfringens TaxID=1502 RepID=UPI001ABBB9CF|nr:restriction endonuclease subunit S [Clostridium perfringens]MBO3311527.1 restriction endonuclease subunit S [Clostridium perfringens]
MSFRNTEIGKLPSEWDVKTLKECSTKITDGTHSTVKDNKDGEYYLLSCKNVKNGNVVLGEKERKIDLDTLKKLRKRTNMDIGDLLLTTVGTIGESAIVKNLNFEFQRSVAIIKLDTKKVNKNFAYYITKDRYFKYQVSGRISGSVQKCLYLGDINNIKIPLPSLGEQKAIAKILSDLDEKIEINNKINKNLEEMAQAIFKQWFVDFEFPNEEGKPYKSSGGEMVESELGMIPKGWKIKNITELVDSISIKHKFDKEKVIFLNTSDILEGKFLNKEYSEISNLPGQAKKSISKDDILYSEIRPKNKRFAYVNFDSEDYVVSTKLMVLRSKNLKYSQVIYYLLTGKEFVEKINILAESRSGTFPQITFSTLKSITLAFPEESRFNLDIFKNILDKFYDLANENEKLEKLRDTLLPKLMSGEIRVPLENNEN